MTTHPLLDLMRNHKGGEKIDLTEPMVDLTIEVLAAMQSLDRERMTNLQNVLEEMETIVSASSFTNELSKGTMLGIILATSGILDLALDQVNSSEITALLVDSATYRTLVIAYENEPSISSCDETIVKALKDAELVQIVGDNIIVTKKGMQAIKRRRLARDLAQVWMQFNTAGI